MPIHPRWRDENDDGIDDPWSGNEPDDEPEPWRPDDDDDDLLKCPECGAEVYEDAQRCPHCECWITPTSGGPVGHWPTWVTRLGLIGFAMTIIVLVFGRRCGLW